MGQTIEQLTAAGNGHDVYVDHAGQEPIRQNRSLETHIFQICDGTAHGTVEWVSMADNRTSVFVPYYPIREADATGCE